MLLMSSVPDDEKSSDVERARRREEQRTLARTTDLGRLTPFQGAIDEKGALIEKKRYTRRRVELNGSGGRDVRHGIARRVREV